MKNQFWVLGVVVIVFALAGCDTIALPVQPTQPASDQVADRAVNSSTARKTYVQNELISFNSFITDSVTKQAKYTDMSASAFSYYRATANIYYKDLNTGVIAVPYSWSTTSQINTWIQGDAHPNNVGFFDNKNGQIKVDLNDFDESFVAPFYWDLIRFTSGIYLLRNESTLGFTLTTTEAQTEADYFLQKYQDTLTSVNGNSSEITMELTSSLLDGFTKAKRDDLASSKSTATLLAKWTKVTSGVRSFDLTNPDLAAASAATVSAVNANWAGYKTGLGSFASSQVAGYFTIKNIAERLNSGLGSRGVQKLYVLIDGPSTSTSDDIILELKEERSPSILLNNSVSTSQYNSWFSNHAARAKTANKALGVDVENHTGTLISASKSYLVRQISPFKFGFDAADFKSQNDLHNWIKFCAQAYAYAHARADKDYSTSYVSYNAESGILNAISVWSSAKTTIRNLGKGYADQIVQDFAFFNSLRSAGQL